MLAPRALLALLFLDLALDGLYIRIITEVHYLPCTSISLPPTGWISTNGSSVPFVFSPTFSKSNRVHTRSRTHISPPVYTNTGTSVGIESHKTHRTHRTSHTRGLAGSDTELPASTSSCVPAIPSPIACPAANGTLYNLPDEYVDVNSYVIRCDTEAGGYELASNPNVPDVPSCIQICDADPSCVAIAYDTTTEECYEKSSFVLDNLTANPHMVFAYQQRRGGTLPSASIIVSSATSTLGVSSPGQIVDSSTTSTSSQVPVAESSSPASISTGIIASTTIPVPISTSDTSTELTPNEQSSSVTGIVPSLSTISSTESSIILSPSTAESVEPTVIASSAESATEGLPTEISSSTLLISTTASSSPSSTPSAAQGPVCPGADGTFYTQTDGSQYLIVCHEFYDAQDDDMPQIDPVEAETLGACLDLCMNQGTSCMGASWLPGNNQCYMKYFMQVAAYPNYEVNSFVRGTGPNGASQGRISNQDFSSGLSPWVSTPAGNGAEFAVVNGQASIHLTISDSGSGSQNGYGYGYDGPADSATLSQAMSVPAGQSWFFYTTFGLSRPSADDPGCTLSFSTDNEVLWTYFYGQILDLHTAINASGVVHEDAHQLMATIYCGGAGDADISFDNFVFATFGQTAGANPILPTQAQLIQNPTFDSGSLDPWYFYAGSLRSIGYVANGRAVMDFNSISNSASTPTFIIQHLTGQKGQKGQTYTILADVDVTLGGNDQCQGSISNGGDNVWSFGPIYSSQTYTVNFSGVLRGDADIFYLYATCQGNTEAFVSWDNVYFTLNT